MKIRLKFILLISLFSLLYALYYWGIPAFIKIENKTSDIRVIVKKEFGIDINLTNPKLKMGILPSVWIEASDFSILEKEKSPFIVESPKIKIKIFPLLIGKIQIAYFSCKKIKNLYLFSHF